MKFHCWKIFDQNEWNFSLHVANEEHFPGTVWLQLVCQDNGQKIAFLASKSAFLVEIWRSGKGIEKLVECVYC